MIELAVGRLRLEDHRYHAVQTHPTQVGIGIVSSDGRSELWLDPRILYVLHDQTVEILIEETADPESAHSPLLTRPVEDGAIMNADGETVQIRGAAFNASDSITVLPDIEPIPDGFLMIPARPNPGKRLNALPDDPEPDSPQRAPHPLLGHVPMSHPACGIRPRPSTSSWSAAARATRSPPGTWSPPTDLRAHP